jgi:RNA polymerase sigma factor (sigma-70 family)
MTKHAVGLLSDEPTVELLVRAQDGDRRAVEAMLQRALPRLRQWVHGRLPAVARAVIDTNDLVQDVALHVIRRLDHFTPRHVGAMQGYLRQAVINRIRDEMRKINRHAAPDELPDDLESDDISPLELAIKAEGYQQYRDALLRLSPRERELVVTRIELQWTHQEIANHCGISNANAARMAVSRALKRLTVEINESY